MSSWWARPMVWLVVCLWWLALTPAERRALAQLADQQERRRRLRVIDGGAGEPMIGPR